MKVKLCRYSSVCSPPLPKFIIAFIYLAIFKCHILFLSS
uniref:Uncharacterized protein n=1 Tax=Anguilla anguilla TaxID=7936 RepID=A0A0E9PWQ6_ANGAN